MGPSIMNDKSYENSVSNLGTSGARRYAIAR
jgi:hypothetical protein